MTRLNYERENWKRKTAPVYSIRVPFFKPRTPRNVLNPKDKTHFLLEHRQYMTKVESEFMVGIYFSRFITERQSNWLNSIYVRVRATVKRKETTDVYSNQTNLPS
jgi:hypothetical protein